jgi:tetratricopeptide (TPR) repeat protein
LKTKLLTDRTAFATAIAIAISMATLGLQASAAPQTAIDEWKTTMSRGDLYETKHDHANAIHAFSAAISLAEAQKLPPKYLTTALCRRTGSEVHQNLVTQSNSDCERLMSLVKVQKLNNTLDPDTEVWVLDLANVYQADENRSTRENSLLKLCMINKVLYGENHKEYRNARTLLGKFYEHEHGQGVKAAQIQSGAEAASARQAGQYSDPMAQATNLNQLAMHLKISGKLEEAKKSELQLLEIAKSNPGVADGIPAYLAFLGTVSLVQGNEQESNGYFAKAIKACSKVKGNKQKETIVTSCLSPLVDSVKFDKNSQVPDLTSKELKQLLNVQQAVSADPRGQYTLNRHLSESLNEEHKFEESDKYMLRAIEIAKLPVSCVDKDVPGLYMKLALLQSSRLGQMDKANQSFAKALESEKNKTGYQPALIYLFWGAKARENGYFPLASDKINVAMNYAQALAPQNRGTLLADALIILSAIQKHDGKDKEVPLTVQKSTDEIQIQRRLHSQLGPDWFHRMQ